MKATGKIIRDEVGWLLGAAGATPAATWPKSFVAFCEELKVQLYPAQRVAVMVAYDGVEPEDLSPEDRETARLMFGDLDRVAPSARDVVVGVCGARAGKTYVLESLRLLHLALTVDLSPLAPGEVASAPIIAPDKDLATQALNYIKGAIASHPVMAAMVPRALDLAAGPDPVRIVRDGQIVEIVCRAASARGRTGRARSLVGAVLDEAAFFMDATYKVNDEEIFKAVRPRVLPGGQTLVHSTPWAQKGLLWALFAANHPNPAVAGIATPALMRGDALALHAPTLLLRPDEAIRKVVEAEERRDPENSLREYGACFMDQGASSFFDAACLAASIDFDAPMLVLPTGGEEVASGCDLGFAANSTTLAVTHHRDGNIVLAEVLELRPAPDAPLKPREVFTAIAERLKAHGARTLMADGHYREAIVEACAEARVGFLDAPRDPAEAFVRARTLMRDGKVKLPNHERLIRQLREVVARKLMGGRVQAVLPKWRDGSHGDLVSAFVLAVAQFGGERAPAPPPPPGSDEARLRLEAERLAARIRQVNQGNAPSWKRGLKG